MYPGYTLEGVKRRVIMLMKHQPGTAPHTTIGSPTMRTVPQPMRSEPDPGTSPKAEPEQDDG